MRLAPSGVHRVNSATCSGHSGRAHVSRNGERVNALDEVIARDAIRQAALRYCRGIDRLDLELVKSAYWPDATDDHGTFRGRGWDFADYAVGRLREAFGATMHTVFNHTIEFEPAGTTALGEIYNVSYHLQRDPPVLYTWWGRYLDRYERRGDEWRILARLVVHEWTIASPATDHMPIASERFLQGSFDRGTPGTALGPPL